jgi:hypothetical protein
MSGTAISEDEYQRREAVYADMGKVLEPLGKRAVLVVFEGEGYDAHVSVYVPPREGEEAEDAHKVLATGEHGLYALSLYTKVLAEKLAASHDKDRQS